jgi:L-iditol 2-dehydrogenase
VKAVQLLGKEKIRIAEVEKPTIANGEVLVKIKAASICGTDVRMYKNGYPGVSEETPLTLGHEIAGEIVEVGAEVDFYEAGMRVAIAPNMGCGVCDQCVSGNTQLCPNYTAFGISLPGGFAEYLVVPEKGVRQGNITVIPDALSFEEAALIEPFSCVYNGQMLTADVTAETVLIIGAGPIGIMHAMLAYSRGAGQVIMNDLSAERLGTARSLVEGLITLTSENLKEKLDEVTNGQGVNLCIVAAPAPQAQEASFDYMATRGRVLFFGGLPKGNSTVSLDTNILHYKQLGVYGCTGASLTNYRSSAALVASGRMSLKGLISERFSIEDFNAALKNARDAIGMKNVIVFD